VLALQAFVNRCVVGVIKLFNACDRRPQLAMRTFQVPSGASNIKFGDLLFGTTFDPLPKLFCKHFVSCLNISMIQLCEGLVKVPAGLERSVLSLFNMHVLWMLRDKAGKAFPEHRRAVIAYAKKLGEPLPKDRWALPSKGFLIVQLPLNISDLPAQYAKLTPLHQSFFVVLDYGQLRKGDDTGGFYWHRTNKEGKSESLIVIDIEKLRGVKEFPTRRSPEEIPFILSDVANIIHHELQHMMQYVLLAPVDKRQTARLPGYQERKTDYYASQVEFDPQIGSAVVEFLEHWNIMSEYFAKGQIRVKPLLSKSIKQFVGLLPSSIGSGFAVNSLFRALHRTDQRRFRDAVKKFVVLVTTKLRTA
jgi:hypothetical protein